MVSETVLKFRAPEGCGIVYCYSYKGKREYVGSTKNTIGERAGTNGKKYVYFDKDSKFGEFILLHGFENLDVEVLDTPKLEELTKVENQYIVDFDLIANGQNKYLACDDDPDEEGFTKKVNGHKANVYKADKLRGDMRVGLIHDETMKLNYADKDVFKDYYVLPCQGNSMEKNCLAYKDENNRHTTVKKTLRNYFFGDLAYKYNLSQNKILAEDIYDFRREVLFANPCGRIDMKRPLVDVLADLSINKDPFPFKRKVAGK